MAESTIKQNSFCAEFTRTSNATGWVNIPQYTGYYCTGVILKGASGTDTIWAYSRENTICLLTDLQGQAVTNKQITLIGVYHKK